MSKVITCPRCGKQQNHFAHGLCQSCYRKQLYRIKHPEPPDMGICPYCNERPISKVRGIAGKTCGNPECRKKHASSRNLRTMKNAMAEGLCCDCRKKPHIPGQWRCPECAEKNNQAAIKSYLTKKKKHEKAKQKQNRYNSQDDIIRTLRKSIEALGYIPSSVEYDKLNLKPRRTTIQNHGLTWGKAMKIAGYEVIEVDHLSCNEIMTELRGYVSKNGGVLNSTQYEKEYRELDLPSPTAVMNNFGSWEYAAEAIGASTVKNKWDYYTEEVLLKLLSEYYETYQETPTKPIWEEYARNNNLPGCGVFDKLFKSWNNALKKAGIIPHRHRTPKWTKEKIIDSLKANFEAMPHRQDYLKIKKGKKHLPSTVIIERHFGTFYDAFKAAGIPGEPPRIGRPMNWK